MTQEDKELLLRDLTARLPYGVICKCLHSNTVKATAIDTEDLSVYYFDCDEWESIEHCKPYLRSMSSMTEEEMDKLAEFHIWNDGEKIFPDCNCKLSDIVSAMNWLNKKMFDYRGLIEKGLALEAPEGMYKI